MMMKTVDTFLRF